MRSHSACATFAASGILALAVALTGCQGAQEASTHSATPKATASVVAIGHSGLTGWDSDTRGVDVLANSWATGTNPAVDSVFERMLATDPGLVAANFAVDGSNVDSLLDVQANEAVSVTPSPKLIIVQSIDNDIQCDGTDAANYPVYRAKLTDVLNILTTGAPNAKIYFVSQWGSVQSAADLVAKIEVSHLEGSGGECDVADTSGQLIPAGIAHVQKLLDDYSAIAAQVCATSPKCLWDGGAEQKLAATAEDLTVDLDHLAPSGQRKEAAIAWSVLGPALAG